LHTESLAEALEPFIEDGLLADVLYPIKSGKEATVYCCSAGPRVKADSPRSISRERTVPSATTPSIAKVASF